MGKNMSNQAKTYCKHFAVGALIAALGAGSYAIAAVVFSDFTTGTTISASEMNAKLNALKDAVNARDASVTCPANTPARFTDNGDGTVCDSQTGLMWEKKTGAVGTAVQCLTPEACLDPHDVKNSYTWNQSAEPFTEPTGTLYSSFLERLNDLKTPVDGTATPCFAGHCDWRVPTVGELRSILQAPGPLCTVNPCIAAGFPGPTQASSYWSSSSLASIPTSAWLVGFSFGSVGTINKAFDFHARAVRGGR
jgi:hypothetical protein